MNAAENISRRLDETKFHAALGNIIKSVMLAGGKIAGSLVYGEDIYNILWKKHLSKLGNIDMPEPLAAIVKQMKKDKEGRGSAKIYDMMVESRDIAAEVLREGEPGASGKEYKSFLKLVTGGYIWLPIEYFATSRIHPDRDTMPRSAVEYMDAYINSQGPEVVSMHFEQDEDIPDVPGIPYLDMNGKRGWKKNIIFEVVVIWASTPSKQKTKGNMSQNKKLKSIITSSFPDKFKSGEYERKVLVVSPEVFKKNIKAGIKSAAAADSIRFTLTNDWVINPLDHINTPKYSVYHKDLTKEFMRMLDITSEDSFPILKYDSPIARFLWLSKGSILYIVQEEYVLDLPTRVIVNYRRVTG